MKLVRGNCSWFAEWCSPSRIPLLLPPSPLPFLPLHGRQDKTLGVGSCWRERIPRVWLLKLSILGEHGNFLRKEWTAKMLVTSSNVCRVSPTYPRNSRTPAACPVIQLNSDTLSLEMASDPAGEGLSPTTLPHLRCHVPTQLVTCTSYLRPAGRGPQDSLLRFGSFARVAHRTQDTRLFTRL